MKGIGCTLHDVVIEQLMVEPAEFPFRTEGTAWSACGLIRAVNPAWHKSNQHPPQRTLPLPVEILPRRWILLRGYIKLVHAELFPDWLVVSEEPATHGGPDLASAEGPGAASLESPVDLFE